MQKKELFNQYKSHLKWLEEMAQKRGKTSMIEQGYGFTLGICLCNEKYKKEILKIWEDWKEHLLYDL